LLISLEDDKDELSRRARTAMLHHGIEPAKLKGWLFLKAIEGPRIAEERDGRVVAGAVDGMVRCAIKRRRIDLVILDPLV